MRTYIPIFLIFAINFLISLYYWTGLKRIFPNIRKSVHKKLSYIFWSLVVVVQLLFLVLFKNTFNLPKTDVYYYTFSMVAIYFAVYLPQISLGLFRLMEDFFSVLFRLFGKRLKIRILSKIAFALGIALVFLVIFGTMVGKYKWDFKEVEIVTPNLPRSFDGVKLVHISDTHLGSFGDKGKIRFKQAFEKINEYKPDLICFTGDLVNNFAEEATGWEDVFQVLKAKYGKYSILGNHDYGDYVKWDIPAQKLDNLIRLKEAHQELGFELLLNQSVQINHNNDSIALLGVENWGKPPFPQHGDLKKTLAGLSKEQFKILLSHDPSHWDEEVVEKENIALTLAGHTHGMQIGLRPFGINWSPIKMKYPRWSGLYEEAGQFLYVNVGMGVIGFSGRIGMPPEITVITLKAE